MQLYFVKVLSNVPSKIWLHWSLSLIKNPNSRRPNATVSYFGIIPFREEDIYLHNLAEFDVDKADLLSPRKIMLRYINDEIRDVSPSEGFFRFVLLLNVHMHDQSETSRSMNRSPVNHFDWTRTCFQNLELTKSVAWG